jgi:putative Mn2+ efflux pump MntP
LGLSVSETFSVEGKAEFSGGVVLAILGIKMLIEGLVF